MLTTLLSHPFNQQACTQRLIKEAVEHKGKLIVAFDFDNTIFDYHNNGGDYSQVIALLQECSKLGMIMILFTAQDDEARLEWMVAYCNHFKINVDYINRSPLLNTTKPYYNILLDDRAGLSEAFSELAYVVEYLKNSQNATSNQSSQSS